MGALEGRPGENSVHVKVEGQKLQSILRRQVDTVHMVDDDGRERCGISARYAADFIMKKEYVGFGRTVSLNS